MNKVLLKLLKVLSVTPTLTRVAVERLDLDKLRLDRGRVDALVVEELLHLLGDLHVLGQVPAADVGGRNDPVAGQLPHVELVHRQHPVHLLQQPPLDGVHLDVRRNGLQQNERGLAEQGPHRVQNQDDQQDRQGRIHVQLVLPLGEPHDQRANDDDHTAEGVAEHMQERAPHVHLGRVVRVAVVGGLLRRGVAILESGSRLLVPLKQS